MMTRNEALARLQQLGSSHGEAAAQEAAEIVFDFLRDSGETGIAKAFMFVVDWRLTV